MSHLQIFQLQEHHSKSVVFLFLTNFKDNGNLHGQNLSFAVYS